MAAAQISQKWTLESCVKYALENNLTVRQSQLTAVSSAKDHLQSKLNLLPTIDLNGTYSDYFGNGINPQTFSFTQGNSQSAQFQLSGSLPLFTGLQQIYNIQRAKYDLLAAQYDYALAQNNIALSVASDYLQILLNKEIEQVSIKQKQLSQAQKDITVARINAGALPQSAIYDIESQIGRDQVAIVNAKNSVDLSLLNLEQLLQLKEDSTFSVETPEVKADNIEGISSYTSQSIYMYAMERQPVVLGSEARVMSAAASQKMAIGNLSPTLSLNGGLSTGYSSQDKKISIGTDTIIGTIIYQGASGQIQIPSPSENYSNISLGQDLKNNFRQAVSLTLDLPLFSRGQKLIGIQKAKLTYQIRQLQLEGSKNQLRQDIEQAYINAKAAAETYFANKTSLEASQKAYQSTETRFKAGAASDFDMQQVRNNLIAAESQLAQAKYTYVFRMKVLDFYQGKPITLNDVQK